MNVCIVWILDIVTAILFFYRRFSVIFTRFSIIFDLWNELQKRSFEVDLGLQAKYCPLLIPSGMFF